jgi:MFS transporter, PPP family, 3-phenylpropionic acid transporter
MGVRPDLSLRFLVLYGTLYCSFGLSSPFLPAFLTGVLVAGQIASVWGLTSILWLTAAGLLAVALSTRFAPDLAEDGNSTSGKPKVINRDWLVLFRHPAFMRMVIAAALVLGSHAMHDAFAIIRWSNAGISPAVSSVLWSESVGAEVLVFVLAGPRLLDMLGRRGALALGAGTLFLPNQACGKLR